MKKIALVGATLVLAMAAGSAAAAPARAPAYDQGPSAGSFGINVPIAGNVFTTAPAPDFLITGSYHITKSMAVLAGLGLQMVDTGATTNNKSTNIGIMGGARYFLKTDDLAPFVGGRLQYSSGKDKATFADVTTIILGAEMGAEYYFSKQFSLEGSASFGYASADVKPVGATSSTKSSVIGTTMINVSANFYF